MREILEFFEVEDGSDDGLPPTINLVGIAIILAILVVEEDGSARNIYFHISTAINPYVIDLDSIVYGSLSQE